MSYGSNVMPSKFGKGKNDSHEDWECFCETINRYYYVKCPICGLKKSFVLESQEVIRER